MATSHYNQSDLTHNSSLLNTEELKAIVNKYRDDTLDYDDEYESAEDIANQAI